MTSPLSRHARELRKAADCAHHRLRIALASGGVTLASLGVDHASPFTGVVLIELGAVRPDTALRLADLLEAGAASERH